MVDRHDFPGPAWPATRLWRLVAAATLCVLVAACAGVAPGRCHAGEQPLTQDTLYFGTGTPDGVVSDAQWRAFVAATVTPRFPQGLTVSEVAGQWRGDDQRIVYETTHVLVLVHPDDPQVDAAVAEIAAAYKTAFRQEAVMRLRSATCASF